MIDDMAFRNMSPYTQKVYAYAVANSAKFHRQSPDKLGLEHVAGLLWIAARLGYRRPRIRITSAGCILLGGHTA
jgi:hypothetical protein